MSKIDSDAYLITAALRAGVPRFWLEEAIQEMKISLLRPLTCSEATAVNRAAIDAVRHYGNYAREHPRIITEELPEFLPIKNWEDPLVADIYLDSLLSRLPRRSQFIIVARLAGYTLMSIGKQLGLSESRVGQIEREGIRRMRTYAREV